MLFLSPCLKYTINRQYLNKPAPPNASEASEPPEPAPRGWRASRASRASRSSGEALSSEEIDARSEPALRSGMNRRCPGRPFLRCGKGDRREPLVWVIKVPRPVIRFCFSGLFCQLPARRLPFFPDGLRRVAGQSPSPSSGGLLLGHAEVSPTNSWNSSRNG